MSEAATEICGADLAVPIQHGDSAILRIGKVSQCFRGRWVCGSPWERFGKYDAYVVLREDGVAKQITAHAGELVPGSTEDLFRYINQFGGRLTNPPIPLTLELDVTYSCTSKDCGGRCFSAPYRSLAPSAHISTKCCLAIIRQFANAGGRIIRFDGGGDPLNHPDVLNGVLPKFSCAQGLKSTLLTCGDLLRQADLSGFVDSNCYVRVSLNAATDRTRQRFHGSGVKLSTILSSIETLASLISDSRQELPIGATFLLDTANYAELCQCARSAKDSGVNHFSVRRVLGPARLRPSFSNRQLDEIHDIFHAVESMKTRTFRVFLPWRSLQEPDLSPASEDFTASRCWQSTFKTVIEPNTSSEGFRVQLCGRYRGSGIGQIQQMAPVMISSNSSSWPSTWQRSFDEYSPARMELIHSCQSCIDRGFICMVDRIVDFVGDPPCSFQIFHLRTIDRS